MSDLIREKTITDIGVRVTGLLREYHHAINKVYEEEGEIKIAMPVKIKFQGGQNKTSVGISFVTDKIDDTSSGFVEEMQLSLFDEKGGRLVNCPILPGDEIFASHCNGKCPHRKQAMMIDGANPPYPLSLIPSRIPDTSMVQYISCAQWSDDDTRASVEAHLKDYDERMKREAEAQKEPVKVYRMGATS